MTAPQRLKGGAGAMLRHARHDADMTIDTLSSKAKVSVGTIVAIEATKLKHPHGRTIYRLAKALDVDPLDLFEEPESVATGTEGS